MVPLMVGVSEAGGIHFASFASGGGGVTIGPPGGGGHAGGWLGVFSTAMSFRLRPCVCTDPLVRRKAHGIGALSRRSTWDSDSSGGLGQKSCLFLLVLLACSSSCLVRTRRRCSHYDQKDTLSKKGLRHLLCERVAGTPFLNRPPRVLSQSDC